MPPSLLYSIVDPSRDGTAFTVPLDGDWVTIAVVAEQLGPVRTTKGGPAMGKEGDSSGDEGVKSAAPKQQQQTGKKRWQPPLAQKKFITYRLVALPPRSSGKPATNGDATVNLILFEADSVVNVKGGKGEGKKVYKGGSGGAFEQFWNIKVGTVLAILNPRVLRPLKVRPPPFSSRTTHRADSLTLSGLERPIAPPVDECTRAQSSFGRDGRCHRPGARHGPLYGPQGGRQPMFELGRHVCPLPPSLLSCSTLVRAQ